MISYSNCLSEASGDLFIREFGLMDGFAQFRIKYLTRFCLILYFIISFPYDLDFRYSILMRSVEYVPKLAISMVIIA